jgi:trans-2,3-dihydro-3-hydroxyanthranilate isomerase
MQRPLSVLRVFTRDGAGGNHLGVVTELDDLTSETMQLIATDLGFSETIFIDTSGDDVPTTRIFTPAMEMPFAGHPLVGAAWSILQTHQGSIDRLRCGIGEVRIRLEGDLAWVDVPMFPANAERIDGAFARQVGLPDPVDVWQVSMPLDYRLVELATAAEVASVVPNKDGFGSAHGLTVFARNGELGRMRFFIPEAGIDEDPATGSAAVALATMWAASGEKSGQVVIHQGEEIGHPSRINLRWAGPVASIGGAVALDESREVSL